MTGKTAKVPIILALLLAASLTGLGLWQLDRAEQKRRLLQERQTRLQQPPVSLNQMNDPAPAALRYRNIEAVGRYDGGRQILIDNQIVGGKAGYYVLTPLKLPQKNKAVLVNRGWLPLGGDRSRLPDIDVSAGARTVRGHSNRFPSVGLKLTGADKPTESWPSVVQVVDTGVLAEKLGYPLYDFQIELDRDQPDGFKREWRAVDVMPPERHVAYAVQWFALAVTVAVLFSLWIKKLK